MILAPWYEPIVFARVWCVFELYCTIACEGKCVLEVAMSDLSRAEFIRAIEEDVELAMDEMFSKIDVKNSKATVPVDRYIGTIYLRP